MLSLILNAIASFALIFLHSMASVSAVVFLWGISWWTFVPAQQSRLIGMAHKTPGIIMAFNGSALYLGMALGGAIGGFILQNFGELSIAWAGASLEVLALIVLGLQLVKWK